MSTDMIAYYMAPFRLRYFAQRGTLPEEIKRIIDQSRIAA